MERLTTYTYTYTYTKVSSGELQCFLPGVVVFPKEAEPGQASDGGKARHFLLFSSRCGIQLRVLIGAWVPQPQSWSILQKIRMREGVWVGCGGVGVLCLHGPLTFLSIW